MDVEFLVRYLQLLHGAEEKSLRTTETIQALNKLELYGYLGSDQSEFLKEGYSHLRLIENGLHLNYDDSNNLLDFDQIDPDMSMNFTKMMIKQLKTYVRSIIVS